MCAGNGMGQSNKDMAYLEGNQEEADTPTQLLHVVDGTTSRDTSIEIISPDTDAFVPSQSQAIPRAVWEHILRDRKRTVPSEDTTQSYRSCHLTC